MRKLIPLMLLTLWSLATPAVGDVHPGQKLHQTHCIACHGPDQYSPEKRKLNDLSGLTKRVNGCSQAAGSGWSQAQIKTVIDYLNQTYYHFPE